MVIKYTAVRYSVTVKSSQSDYKTKRVWFSYLVLFLIVGLAVIIYPTLRETSGIEKHLAVTIFDVGQGDSALIETPNGIQILIDGGPDNTVLRKLAKQLGFFDRDLDLLIATHPDRDHIAGLNDVLGRYLVTEIVMTEKLGSSVAAEVFFNLVNESSAKVVYARSGQVYQFSDGVKLEILFPDRSAADFESNTASIIAKLQYGEIGFMFTGDSPKQIEDYLVQTYGDSRLESEMLKLGHHGSDTSTSRPFLKATRPEIAVVSAGKNNRYGHPSEAVLDRLKEEEITVLDTASLGDITFYSDGDRLWLETENSQLTQ